MQLVIIRIEHFHLMQQLLPQSVLFRINSPYCYLQRNINLAQQPLVENFVGQETYVITTINNKYVYHPISVFLRNYLNALVGRIR